MKVAFYAPMKPTDHPVPSGDRAMGQSLLRALRAAGHETFVVSRFRSFDGRGDATRQQRSRCWATDWRASLGASATGDAARPLVHLLCITRRPTWLGPR
jgi:hypothetical protein